MDTIKCVLVGDGCVGKRYMAEAYVNNVFPQDYTPTVFDVYSKSVVVKGKSYNLSIHITAGQEDYNRLRPLSYPQTDVFLVCFSSIEPTSYHNVQDKWYPELSKHCPNVPKILVGTKIDLRDDKKRIAKHEEKKESILNKRDGIKLAEKIKAMKYMECSALTRVGLNEVFEAVVCTAQSQLVQPHERRKCLIS